VFAIWLAKNLPTIVWLAVGGELSEYTEMMGSARIAAPDRMIDMALEVRANVIVNIRNMTASVVGSAAELLVYATAVWLNDGFET